jgi:hypothetical protein
LRKIIKYKIKLLPLLSLSKDGERVGLHAGRHNKLTVTSIFIQNQFIVLCHYLLMNFRPMNNLFGLVTVLLALSTASFAQKEKVGKNGKGEVKGREKITVPIAVKEALSKKYPGAIKVAWEKENGNYEANWGGKSGEDNSVQFTPSGNFIEMVKSIPISELPKPVISYVKEHYNGVQIKEAGKVTDAQGKLSYEAEVKGKDIIFDERGNFVKAEK